MQIEREKCLKFFTVITKDPVSSHSLYHFHLIYAILDIGVQDWSSIFQLETNNGLICSFFEIQVLSFQISLLEFKRLVGRACDLRDGASRKGHLIYQSLSNGHNVECLVMEHACCR